MKIETPIPGYDFSSKREGLNKILNTPEYQEYKSKKNAKQNRNEKIYKFISIGNSTNSVRNLILINIITFILTIFLFPSTFQYLALFNITDTNFAIWQPITSMFLHAGIIHLLFNMIVLWSFGNAIENSLGIRKFLSLYFLSGLISGIFWMFLGTGPGVGASGALMGLFSAFMFISPNTTVYLFFFIPIKIKKLFYGFAIFSLVFGLLSLVNPSYGFRIAHFAHLGGMIGGYALTYYWRSKNLIPTY